MDVDLEWKYVDYYYSFFVLVFGWVLYVEGKMIIVVLLGKKWYKYILDVVLCIFDFINIMAYDLIGFWVFNFLGLYLFFMFVEFCL